MAGTFRHGLVHFLLVVTQSFGLRIFPRKIVKNGVCSHKPSLTNLFEAMSFCARHSFSAGGSHRTGLPNVSEPSATLSSHRTANDEKYFPSGVTIFAVLKRRLKLAAPSINESGFRIRLRMELALGLQEDIFVQNNSLSWHSFENSFD